MYVQYYSNFLQSSKFYVYNEMRASFLLMGRIYSDLYKIDCLYKNWNILVGCCIVNRTNYILTHMLTPWVEKITYFKSVLGIIERASLGHFTSVEKEGGKEDFENREAITSDTMMQNKKSPKVNIEFFPKYE